MDIDRVSKLVSGRRISQIEAREKERLAIVFEDGCALLIQPMGSGVSLEFAFRDSLQKCPDLLLPTLRQREYLEFIEKYLGRFGFAPSELDIQRHFLVSAPSVNGMMQTLERHGFITRLRGVGRSTRLVLPAPCKTCGRAHFQKGANAAAGTSPAISAPDGNPI